MSNEVIIQANLARVKVTSEAIKTDLPWFTVSDIFISRIPGEEGAFAKYSLEFGMCGYEGGRTTYTATISMINRPLPNIIYGNCTMEWPDMVKTSRDSVTLYIELWHGSN